MAVGESGPCAVSKGFWKSACRWKWYMEKWLSWWESVFPTAVLSSVTGHYALHGCSANWPNKWTQFASSFTAGARRVLVFWWDVSLLLIIDLLQVSTDKAITVYFRVMEFPVTSRLQNGWTWMILVFFCSLNGCMILCLRVQLLILFFFMEMRNYWLFFFFLVISVHHNYRDTRTFRCWQGAYSPVLLWQDRPAAKWMVSWVCLTNGKKKAMCYLDREFKIYICFWIIIIIIIC